MSFDYASTGLTIRSDIAEAHRRAWEQLGSPGSWWTGAERVAIAAELRAARECVLCRRRKEALSPESLAGDHDRAASVAALPAAAIEAIHRITTDPSRLSRAWYQQTVGGDEMSEGHYVELVGVLVAVLSIDVFHLGLGLPLEALPEPVAGEPSHYQPLQARREDAYVRMCPVKVTGAESDLWQGRTGNVVRAMSLVPDAVRQLKDLSAAHYLSMEEVPDPSANGGRAITRAQIELLAGRVSALNECFY